MALEYWSEKPNDSRGRIERHRGISAPQTEESRRLREEINHTYPGLQQYAEELGVAVSVTSYPAPAVGGPVIRSNLLGLVLDQYAGHSRVPREQVIDAINRCIGAAKAQRERLLWRQALNPFWYIVEMFAFLLRVPFLILRYR